MRLPYHVNNKAEHIKILNEEHGTNLEVHPFVEDEQKTYFTVDMLA